MEDDQGENADCNELRGRIDQSDNRRYDPAHSEYHTQPAKALAKGWGPQHGYAKRRDACRHDGKPCEEQCIKDTPGCLPDQDERRLIRGSYSRSKIEVGKGDGRNMRERASRKHAKPKNTQDAPKEGGGETRPAESARQGEEEGNPEHEGHQV